MQSAKTNGIGIGGMMARPEKTSTPTAAGPVFCVNLNVLLIILTALILLTAIGFLLYKTDRTGMIHDESVCVFQFADSMKNVWTNYRKAGNHILHSFFMYLSLKWFKGYEHCIRIPSVFFGIVFMLSMTWLLIKTVRLRVLLPVAAAMILFSQFVFSYAFLSRGYAYALGGGYLYLAIVLWLMEHKIAFRFGWIPVVVFSFLNVLVLGAMLTSVLMLTAINLCVILYACPKFYKEPVSYKKAVLVNFCGMTLLSGLGSYLVYMKVLAQMADTIARDPSAGQPFFPYMKDLLGTRIFSLNTPLQKPLLILFFVLAGAAVLIAGIRALSNRPRARMNFQEFSGSFECLICLCAIGSILVIFVFNVIFKKPLGYPRNQVFLIPLILYAAVLLFDRFLIDLPKVPQWIFTAAVFLLGIGMTWNNFPESQYAVSYQSISGPLLRELHAIDPDRAWKISSNPKLTGLNPSLQYYLRYGYKYQWVPAQYADVYINRPWWEPTDAPRVNRKLFEQFGCSVLIGPNFPKDNVIPEYNLKEP